MDRLEEIAFGYMTLFAGSSTSYYSQIISLNHLNSNEVNLLTSQNISDGFSLISDLCA